MSKTGAGDGDKGRRVKRMAVFLHLLSKYDPYHSHQLYLYS